MESQKFQHMVLTWRLYKQADQFLQFARTEEGRNHPVVVAFMDAKAAFYSRSSGVQVDAEDEQIDVVGYFYGLEWKNGSNVRVPGGNRKLLHAIVDYSPNNFSLDNPEQMDKLENYSRYFNATRFTIIATTVVGRQHPTVVEFFAARHRHYNDTAREEAATYMNVESLLLEVVGYFYGFEWKHGHSVPFGGGNSDDLERLVEDLHNEFHSVLQSLNVILEA